MTLGEKPYPTLGNFVFLGNVNKSIKQRAKKAGLEVISKDQWMKLYDNMTTPRQFEEVGVWYDTVRYK